MTLVDFELELHRKATERFIAADPTSITLIPRTETTVAGTKFFTDGTVRSSQDFKIIWAGDNGVVRTTGSEGGVRRFDFILVGCIDAELAIGDHWSIGSQEYEVTYIFPPNGYEVKGGGISHGASPG